MVLGQIGAETQTTIVSVKTAKTTGNLSNKGSHPARKVQYSLFPHLLFMFEIERIRVEQVHTLFTELNVKQLGKRSAKEGAETKWKRT